MHKLLKNIAHSQVLPLVQQVQYLDGQIVSKTLAQSQYHSITLFAFDKGEEISAHDSSGDAMILVLDGHCQVTIDDKLHQLTPGDSIVMPATILHALAATERCKLLLIVVFATNTLK